MILVLVACDENSIPDSSRPVTATARPPVMIEVDANVAVVNVATDRADWNNPLDPAWNAIQQYSVAMSMAPPVHQSVNLRHDPSSGKQPMYFRFVADSRSLFIQLQWDDATENRNNAFEKFSDGVAVQFALAGGAKTSYMMGTSSAPANIWYWKAESGATQNLVAGGFGSTTMLDEQMVSSRADYSKGRWSVVFSRPMTTNGKYNVDLSPGQDVYLAFAQWQGEDKQRDGLKRVTQGWIKSKIN